ncbi:hypothetical protein [Kiloniella sp. b19]|uniref:hypothetical protein n=1 Tax=Kiloniella sp. GXU_MW_B19 TaxID=3141326 RepID=UPI0031DE7668
MGVVLSVCLGAKVFAAGLPEARLSEPEELTQPLLIEFSSELDFFTLASLAVEVDGVDVTSLLELEGSNLAYKPLRDFGGGEHQVRLFRILEDGSSELVSEWTFVLEGAPSGQEAPSVGPEALEQSDPGIAQAEQFLRSAYFRADTLTEFSARFADNNLDSDPDNGILSGAGDLNAGLEAGNWTVQSRLNYLVQSEQELSLTERAVDIGEYDISALYDGEAVRGGVVLGHQSVGQNSLLMSDFYRRGGSVRIGDARGRLEARAFALSTRSLVGARDFTGLNDSRNRVQGGQLTARPFSSEDNPDALTLTGSYYRGEGDDSGEGLSSGIDTPEGQGWGLTLAKGFNNLQTRLKADYALTRTDLDGNAGAAPEDSAEAIRLQANHRIFEEDLILNESNFNIETGLGYERVDSFFNSLANPGLAVDRDAVTANALFYWGAFSGGLNLLTETNNVDDLESLPTDRLNTIDGSLNYSFSRQEDDLAWLGTPYLFASGFHSDLFREETPAGYTGPDTDLQSSSLSFGGGSSYEEWNWSASYSVSRFVDQTNVSNDTLSNLAGVFAGWQVNERLYLNSGIQFGVLEDQDLDRYSYTTNMNMGFRAELIPDVLDWGLDYNLNLANGSGDSTDSHILNSEVEWTVLPPETNRPGFAVALQGALEDFDESTDTSINETEYQLFVVLRVKAPFSVGGY